MRSSWWRVTQPAGQHEGRVWGIATWLRHGRHPRCLGDSLASAVFSHPGCRPLLAHRAESAHQRRFVACQFRFVHLARIIRKGPRPGRCDRMNSDVAAVECRPRWSKDWAPLRAACGTAPPWAVSRSPVTQGGRRMCRHAWASGGGDAAHRGDDVGSSRSRSQVTWVRAQAASHIGGGEEDAQLIRPEAKLVPVVSSIRFSHRGSRSARK